jgi:hypothetical protein
MKIGAGVMVRRGRCGRCPLRSRCPYAILHLRVRTIRTPAHHLTALDVGTDVVDVFEDPVVAEVAQRLAGVADDGRRGGHLRATDRQGLAGARGLSPFGGSAPGIVR